MKIQDTKLRDRRYVWNQAHQYVTHMTVYERFRDYRKSEARCAEYEGLISTLIDKFAESGHTLNDVYDIVHPYLEHGNRGVWWDSFGKNKFQELLNKYTGLSVQ